MSTLDAAEVERLARHLEAAEHEVRAVSKITDEHPELDFSDAYAIQRALCQVRVERGHRVVGYKAGLTSRAKMQQMGVDTPVFGRVFDDMSVADGGEVDTSALIHPRVEAEIAFVMKRELRGPGCHIGAVLAATDFVVPALEIIDSRYENFRFDLPSVVADNTSASRFVVGGVPASVAGLDLRSLGIVLEKNGEPVAVAAGAAVLSHPAAAVSMLVNSLAEQGEALPAGAFVMSGGATEAVVVAAGDALSARVQRLGQVGVRFK